MSAPSFILVCRRLPAPRSFMTRKTKSVASPPICKPKLPPSSAYMAGAPQGPEVLTGAAHHRAAAVAAPNNKRRFQHRRHDHHATGFVNKVLRDVIRNIEDLLHHFSRILKTVLLSFCFALIFCKHEW